MQVEYSSVFICFWRISWHIQHFFFKHDMLSFLHFPRFGISSEFQIKILNQVFPQATFHRTVHQDQLAQTCQHVFPISLQTEGNEFNGFSKELIWKVFNGLSMYFCYHFKQKIVVKVVISNTKREDRDSELSEESLRIPFTQVLLGLIGGKA